MKRKIIGIGYKMGSGKDALADCLVAEHGYVKYRFADAVKDVATAMFGCAYSTMNSQDGKNSIEPITGRVLREVLQIIGESARTGFGSTVWIRILLAKIDESSDQNIVIPDLRYRNEFEVLKGRGIVCRIDRPREKRGLGPPGSAVELHASETQLDGVPDEQWHAVVNNSGNREYLSDYAGHLDMFYGALRAGTMSQMRLDDSGMQCCSNENAV